MKKSLLFAIMATLCMACQHEEKSLMTNDGTLVITGSCSAQARTAFGTPDETIPFLWSAGDYIWLGTKKSEAISEACSVAEFTFKGVSSLTEEHILYNTTGEAQNAKVLAEQTADGNLGNDGDFGYAALGADNTFRLAHKTAYIWFDTTSAESDLPKLTTITLSTEHILIAGERRYDCAQQAWANTTSNGASAITLSFAEGHQLQAANSEVMATMVALPATIAGTTVTITYTFEDGSTFTEERTPKSNLSSGKTLRVSTSISKADLQQALDHELRVLTFEDKDARFEPYWLDYADWWSGREIKTWSDLIDQPQYGGPLMYGNDTTDACYRWYDEGNTELYHEFPDNGAYCFWGGGHAISDYWGAGYADEDRNRLIVQYYGQEYLDQFTGVPGADQALGWFLLQLMPPVAPHSGKNFAVQYGYKDDGNYIEALPELSFYDCEPRIIDHMYVTNTNYTLNQLHNGVKSEEGNTFGGNWTGLKEDAWLKIAAYGFASIDDSEPCSEAEFYLVKGFQVVEDWTKWDLTGLGKVAKVQFNFLYSPEMGGRYGFTIPGYFAYDDIAVRFEK